MATLRRAAFPEITPFKTEPFLSREYFRTMFTSDERKYLSSQGFYTPNAPLTADKLSTILIKLRHEINRVHGLMMKEWRNPSHLEDYKFLQDLYNKLETILREISFGEKALRQRRNKTVKDYAILQRKFEEFNRREPEKTANRRGASTVRIAWGEEVPEFIVPMSRKNLLTRFTFDNEQKGYLKKHFRDKYNKQEISVDRLQRVINRLQEKHNTAKDDMEKERFANTWEKLTMFREMKFKPGRVVLPPITQKPQKPQKPRETHNERHPRTKNQHQNDRNNVKQQPLSVNQEIKLAQNLKNKYLSKLRNENERSYREKRLVMKIEKQPNGSTRYGLVIPFPRRQGYYVPVGAKYNGKVPIVYEKVQSVKNLFRRNPYKNKKSPVPIAPMKRTLQRWMLSNNVDKINKQALEAFKKRLRNEQKPRTRLGRAFHWAGGLPY